MATGGVTALISKVSCESLGIRNPSLLDEALKEVEGLVEAFCDGTGPKKLGTTPVPAPRRPAPLKAHP